MISYTYTETYDLLISIVGEAPYGIIACDLKGDIIIANQLACDYLWPEESANSLIDQNLVKITNSIPVLSEKLSHSLKKGRNPIDLENVPFDQCFFSIRGRKILNGMIVTIADVTRIKEMEAKSINSVIRGQEDERKRLAREIHDGLGPTLSTIKMKMQLIHTEMQDKSEDLILEIDKAYNMIDELAEQMREISHSLMPRALEDFGLIEAIDGLCNKVLEVSPLKMSFKHSGIETRLAKELEFGIYRICQELLNNTLKYGKAKHINIQLDLEIDDVLFRYSDDGGRL